MPPSPSGDQRDIDVAVQQIKREAAVAPYKPPPPVDDAGFMRDLGIGIGSAAVAIALIVVVVRKLLDRKFRSKGKLVDHELITITGVVRAAGEPLIAPLSGKACVAHRSRAYLVGESRERERDEGNVLYGKVPAGLEKNLVEEARIAFRIETPDGLIHIDDDAFELAAITPERVIPRQQDREHAFLAKLGAPDKHDKAGFDEVVVAVGAKATLRGMLRIEADPGSADERGYRDDAPKRMRLVAADGKQVTVARVWDA
jgi:hypothetical protein